MTETQERYMILALALAAIASVIATAVLPLEATCPRL